MANKYISQLRRGWKGIDKNGNTTYSDGTPIDDWKKYESDPNHIDPLEGELVLEYDNGVPRLKIGDGVHAFSALPYMSVDSFILPTKATVTIYPDKWMRLDCDENIIDKYGNIVGKDGKILELGYYEVDANGNIIDVDGRLIENRYVQFVDVANATVTPNSMIDIQPAPSDVVVFREKDLTFTAINAGGKVRICVVGQKPTGTYTFSATVTEVVEYENS